MTGIIKRISDYFQKTEDVPLTKPGLTKEKAKSGKQTFGVQIWDPNPDDLLTAKGKGVSTYQDMLREPYVKAALRNLKFEVLSNKWKIVPPSDSADDVKRAEELETNLHELEGQTFIETMYAMLDALDCGYSITEKVMKENDGKYDYRKFKSLDTYYYRFGTNEYSNIDAVVAHNVTNLAPETQFDPRFFVIYTNMPRYSNPYGTSELRAAYRAFWYKDNVWKFRAIYMERYGVPPLIGKIDSAMWETVKDQMLTVMKQMQVESAIVLPKDMEIQAMDYSMQSTAEYESSIEQLNKEILVGILGSFMTVDVSAKTGARAHAEVHEDVMVRAAQYMAHQLEDVINEQIVRPWYDLRVVGKEYGRFEFIREDDFDRESEAKAIETLVKAGLKLSQKEIRDKYGFTPPEDDEDVLAIAPSSFGVAPTQESEDIPDDEALIRLRESLWPRLDALTATISAKCFQAIKKSGVLVSGDILKATDMKLPVNVGEVKTALADFMMYGNLLGRGGKVEGNLDDSLRDVGMDSETFSEKLREYEADAHRLAGELGKRLQADFRRELLSAVAGGGTELDLWAKFQEIVAERHGIGNYTDAVDVEALSLGYNDGFKHRISSE